MRRGGLAAGVFGDGTCQRIAHSSSSALSKRIKAQRNSANKPQGFLESIFGVVLTLLAQQKAYSCLDAGFRKVAQRTYLLDPHD